MEIMAEQVRTHKFSLYIKVGLKNYEKFGDWRRHRGEEAIIVEILNRNSSNDSIFGFNYRIEWEDGDTSRISEEDIIRDWDE